MKRRENNGEERNGKDVDVAIVMPMMMVIVMIRRK
jgi:hypothetical protein